ncbi:hypothetical protein [uncultured Deinococcus sp.]|uniref:hypothetical protein n=1 Tax=uncultured Deinococcus sp. TaxID=158789 RepID=UPI0025CDDB61|nr:hypothetical protein [uncultured Deinococcus sp.]
MDITPTTFIVQVSAREMRLVRRYEEQVLAALGQTLAVTFGLPFPSPAHVCVRPGPVTSFLGFGGQLPRVPDPLEVQGAITGALYGVATTQGLRPHPRTAPGA